MKIVRSILLLLISSFSFLRSQTDSLKINFQKDSAHIYRFKKIRPWFAIDQRHSWIKNDKGAKKVPVIINGFQAGVILKEKHAIGLGIYAINKQTEKPVKLVDQTNKITYEELLLKYTTLCYQYKIVNTRFFQLDVPMEVGIGNYIYNLKDETQTVLLWREQGQVKLTGGGVEIVIKPFKWIGLSAMAGFRIVTFNKKTNLNFNGAYYSYGVWIDLRQIYRDIKFYGFVRPKYRKKVKALSSYKS